MADYPHKILNNPKGTVTYFDGSRGFENTTDEDDEPEETVKDYAYQKQVLGQALTNYTSERTVKYERRTIQVPFSIDYIRIDFLVTLTISVSLKPRTGLKKNLD